MYSCQIVGENASSLALKSVLRHLSHIFEHFSAYYVSIESTFAKIRAEMFLRRFRNQFYGIRCTLLITLVARLRQLDIPLPRYGLKCFFAGYETGVAIYFIPLNFYPAR